MEAFDVCVWRLVCATMSEAKGMREKVSGCKKE